MTTIAAMTTDNNNKYQTVFWGFLQADDDGVVSDLGKYPDKTLQIMGVVGAVGTFVLEGSMDNSTWVPLTSNGVDPIGTLGMFYVWENPRYFRPRTIGGDGATLIAFTLGMSTLV